MMSVDDLAELARPVLADVHRTTSLRLAFAAASWFGDGSDEEAVYGVIHRADQAPVQDAGGYYGTSRDFGQTIFRWDNEHDPSTFLPFESAVCFLADQVSSVVQLALFAAGSDPSWPPCPEHAGRHPMRPVAEHLEAPRRDRQVPMTASWRCYQPIEHPGGHEASYGPTAIPLGRLAVIDGRATVAE